MNEEEKNKKSNFKFNMSFYYQSTIIYFVVFVLYVLIRGEFIEGSFVLITRDPIIYFFGIIVLISLLSLLYNLYKRKSLQINESGILFVNRFKSKVLNKDQIQYIKISERRHSKKNAIRVIKIKPKDRERRILIRPYDYENENELIEKFQELKSAVEKNNV